MTFSDLLIQNNPTLAAILYPMLIGLIIGATVVLFNKQVIGKLVKKLLDDKIHSEGSAKTLDELGFGKSRMLKFLLRDGTTLRKVVKTAEGGEAGAAARYYIPQDCAYINREDHFQSDISVKLGSSVITVVIAIVMFIALTFIMMTVIPDLIQMLKNAINAPKS